MSTRLVLDHGDLETDDDARALEAIATKADELGCFTTRGTNDRTEWTFTLDDQAVALGVFISQLRYRPYWWRWTYEESTES